MGAWRLSSERRISMRANSNIFLLWNVGDCKIRVDFKSSEAFWCELKNLWERIFFYLYTNNSVKTLTRKGKNSERCLMYTLQVAKEVFYIQDSQKCQSQSNVLQISGDSIVWKFLPSRVRFHGLNFHKLEKCWKNQIKTSNYWECVTSDYYDCVSKIFKYNFQYLGATFKFLKAASNSWKAMLILIAIQSLQLEFLNLEVFTK